MKALSHFLLGMLVGAFAVYGSLRYHVVRTDEGVEVIPKVSATFSETYVDVREFGSGDWANHKELTLAVIGAQKQHLLQDAAVDQLRDGVGAMIDGLTR